MTCFDLILGWLASSAVLDVWGYGSLFESSRAAVGKVVDRCNPDNDDPPAIDASVAVEFVPASAFVRLCPCWIADLLQCRFCQSYHVPLWILIWILVANHSGHHTAMMMLPVHSLALTKLLLVASWVKDEYTNYWR